jgi:uncharacterized protein (TIGR02996 family)
VSEDEAFIRAVVDSPGDDTARLVYADWLDDHSDPRGPYLRAEFEWATPWRSGERPAESAELRALAARLDPVWVARVSRPPAGACCEQIAFTERGPLVTREDLDSFERTAGIRLPHDYRAFLHNVNGGFTPVAWLPTPGRSAGLELACLFALGPPVGQPPTGVRGSLKGLQEFGDDAWPLLPIGDSGSTDWLIVMDVTASISEVLLFEDFSDSGLIPLADSFAHFLSILEPHGYAE